MNHSFSAWAGDHRVEGIVNQIKRALKRLHFYSAFRSWIIRFFWARPNFYRWIKQVRSQDIAYNDACDIVFDGFYRSGNTFGAQSLAISQGDHIKVEFHKHRPPFLIHALQQGKPVCLTIRNPCDAVRSKSIYSGEKLDLLLTEYMDFYTVMLPHLSELLVVPFSLITSDFKTVLLLINRQFGMKLRVPDDWQECKREAFCRIDDLWRDDSGEIKEWQVARPSSARNIRNDALREELKQSSYREKIDQSEKLYQIFYQRFQEEIERL